MSTTAFQFRPTIFSAVMAVFGHPMLSTSSGKVSITAAPAAPDTRMLVGPISERWKLRRPLRIMIEIDDDGTYIASDDEFAAVWRGCDQRRGCARLSRLAR